MSYSQRLRLRDVRAVYQLIGEIGELGLHPNVWRRHMLERLCALTGARVGLTMDLKNAMPGQVPVGVDIVDVGFEGDYERTYFIEYMKSADQKLQDPPLLPLLNSLQKHRFVTRTRDELVDTKTWYSSPVVSEARKGSRVDQFLACATPLDRPGRITGFILYRGWGESAFRARSRNLARLFNVELQRRIWPTGQRGPGDFRVLPLHLRIVLGGLLRGESAKEMAVSTNLSHHTIASYTRELYDRLGISSRGELTNYFLKTLGWRPVLLPHDFDA